MVISDRCKNLKYPILVSTAKIVNNQSAIPPAAIPTYQQVHDDGMKKMRENITFSFDFCSLKISMSELGVIYIHLN